MIHVLKVFIPSRSGIPEIRRFTVSSSTLSSHPQFVEKIIASIPKLAGKCFELYWKDNDGDDVTIADDNDLAQAVANLEDDVFKVYLRFSDSGLDTPTKGATSDEHPFVSCDGCNTKIVGFRYKCLQCHDFDLCSDCNAAGKHPFHDMIKLVSPMNYPRQWLFVGWKRFFQSMFGIAPVTDVIDRSESFRKGSASKCPYIASLNPQSKNKESPEEILTVKSQMHDLNNAEKSKPSASSSQAEEKSKASPSASSSQAEEKSKGFPPGFPYNLEYLHPGLNNGFGDNACPNIPENFRNLIAENAVPVCNMINAFLKPFGADLRVEVETPPAESSSEKNEKPKEEAKDKVNESTNTQSASSEECGGVRPKSKSPSFENITMPKISHGLFTHNHIPKFANVEVINMSASNGSEGSLNTSNDGSSIDLTNQEMNGNAEGWTVINPPCEKEDTMDKSNTEIKDPSLEEITISKKISSTNVKHPVIEEAISSADKINDKEVKYVVDEAPSVELKSAATSGDDDVEDISKLDPEIANSLLKMRAMGFTNEGGWLLRLLQAKKGNIYHALDSLYPNQTQRQ